MISPAPIRLSELLATLASAGAFPTEDALHCFLPLGRQVLAAHAAQLVAPLEGPEALFVDGGRLYFEEARRLKPRDRRSRLRELEGSGGSGVEVIGESRWTTDVDTGVEEIVDLRLGEAGAPVTRPVYLPGFVAWEHELGHHDALTDVYSLGLVLASLALGLDLGTAEGLARFVGARGRLFSLNPELNPVVAKAIVRMTELRRARRAQDLAAILGALASYRDQDVDFALDLARIPGFREKDLRTRRSLVLARLGERLFDVSRRNRLLHFKPTLHTVNLTQASIPVVMDARSISPSQIFTWSAELQRTLVSGEAFSLGKYLRFEHHLYLPSALEALRSEVRRNLAELGFAELRLVACFLRWWNVKLSPPERFDSPLVLVPVELTKKKGVRDVWVLRATSSEAEVNPVVRHQLKELYGLELPEALDLAETDLDRFHAFLEARIRASEPGISLEKIEKPRIELIQADARRRLDQYRRRTRIGGRGVRSYQSLEYSYQAHNFHPLGIRLFQELIVRAETHLHTLLGARQSPRRTMAPADPLAPVARVASRERELYSLRTGEEGSNPYAWELDLTSLTLANFRHRKMSLVRDYETLTAEELPNPVFDQIFSLAPRPSSAALAAELPLDESYAVVACDPTQASAIAAARGGSSYIIQGPPGTGKSQTITNLIADAVARGQRVLFVCEKRAAIDVVFHRLRQVGLDRIACLIHDAQEDKKAVIMDLKACYEGLVARRAEPNSVWQALRVERLAELRRELEPLERHDSAMRAEPEAAGLPLRELLERGVALAGERPELDALTAERLPPFALWREHAVALERLGAELRHVAPDGVFARHALHRVSPSLAAAERPLEVATHALGRARALLAQIEAALVSSGLGRDAWGNLERVAAVIGRALELEPLALRDQLALVDTASAPSGELARALKSHAKLESALGKALAATRGWRSKLDPEETQVALGQARALAGALGFLRPAWWRLRRVLRERFDFAAAIVKPSSVQVLEALAGEHARRAELEEAEVEARARFRFDDGLPAFAARLAELRVEAAALAPGARELDAALRAGSIAAPAVLALAAAAAILGELRRELGRIIEGSTERPLERLAADLDELERSLHLLPDMLPCLAALGELPATIAALLRELPLRPDELEAAVAHASVTRIYRGDRALERFDGRLRDRHLARIARLHAELRAANAGAVREAVERRFLERLRSSDLPAAQLDAAQKELKKTYSRGRRALEHEFGKSMRFRSLRDLLAAESGEVIQDLKPIWLMSPLSVSDTLPLDSSHFDLVIFDEASQIRLEEAVPSAFRASQVVVVGDEMQLPPTSFFSASQGEVESLEIEEEGTRVEYDLESDSFLNHAARTLAATMLGWHYRSRSESLINFSNAAFYRGELLTVPEPAQAAPSAEAIVVSDPAEGAARVADLLARSLSFHRLTTGVYEKRRNEPEAAYVAELVRGLLAHEATPRPSLGIVAFSEAQQDAIERALERLAREDRAFGARYELELEREEDDQFVGLIVKNLENIQGDERDVIILSICYGPGPDGRMLMNFGPINQNGGERRLNVAFSRAKRHMAVVSSIQHAAIRNDYNQGARCLKSYLRYAEATSEGDRAVAAAAIGELTRRERAAAGEPSAVVEKVAEALRARGLEVDRDVGQSHFRADLAVKRPGEPRYALAVLVDTREHYACRDILERDVMRPELLRAFDWRVFQLLAKDWYQDPAAALERLLARLEQGEAEAAEAAIELSASAASAASAPSAGGEAAVASPPAARESEDAAVAASEAAVEPADAEAASIAPGASAPRPVASEPQASLAGRRFEHVAAGSSKFWEVSLTGATQSVRFGRIGTQGQLRTKLHADARAAALEVERLIAEKVRKGYREVKR